MFDTRKYLPGILLISIVLISCQTDNKTSTQDNISSAIQHKGIVSGIIYDSNDRPLPMASINAYIATGELSNGDEVIEQTGAASDFDGEYWFPVSFQNDSAGVKLIFSFSYYPIDTVEIYISPGDTIRVDHSFRL